MGTDIIHPLLREPTRPKHPVPADACDCHAHIFESVSEIPMPQPQHAKSKLAPFDTYVQMLERIGFSRAVLVQPTAYGDDHRALLRGLAKSQGRMRGVAVQPLHAKDAALDALHVAGVRGLRFNQLVGGGNNVGLDQLPGFAPRLRERGWHAQIYATCDHLAEVLPELLHLEVPIVIDHLARVGPGQRTIDDPAFRYVRDVLKEGRIWLKLTTYRNSNHPGVYTDMRPFHDAFVAANADRLLWGSDWPYLSAGDYPPDTGTLVDLLADWVTDASLRRKILSENPQALYGFTSEGAVQ